MTTLIAKVFQHREQLILFFMLEFIHFPIWTDVTSMVSRSLLLIHLGLFLLWQPIWKGNEKLSWFDIVLLSFISYTFLFLMDWWLIFSWIILLMGLTGGRVIINRRRRLDIGRMALKPFVSSIEGGFLDYCNRDQ